MLQDVILATVGDIDVSLLFPDGSTAVVRQHTISRSAVLRQTIPVASTDDEVQLTVPMVVMASWLESIEALKNGFAYTRPAAPFSDRCSDPQITMLLKVRFIPLSSANLAYVCETVLHSRSYLG